jgi:hypothetical protein
VAEHGDMMHNLLTGWFWLVWGLVGLTYEIFALVADKKYTLSEQLWSLEGSGATALRYFVGVATLWLFLHLTFRWFQ